MVGIVSDVLIAKEAGAKLTSISEAELVSGKGIVGDRYYNKVGTFSKALEGAGDFEVTLIEQEEIDGFNDKTGLSYSPSEFRRNIITKNIEVSSFIGREFCIGDVVLRGVRYCEPCAYLANILGQEVMDHMVHKAGLRAIIVLGGNIKTGDSIKEKTS